VVSDVFGAGEGPSEFENLSLAALAWEMLRRSPGYQAAYAKSLATDIEAQEAPPGAASLWDGGAEWGLVFSGRPVSELCPAGGVLAS
jgi:Family of unknown function (DUF6499)